jgi:hypothetical protein
VTYEEFDFEGEFALLDIGATSSFLRTGCLRPTIIAFAKDGGVESVALDWQGDGQMLQALEDARRYVRNLEPVAYALIAHLSQNGSSILYHLPGGEYPTVNEYLALGLFSEAGYARTVVYPIRHSGGKHSLGMPTVCANEEITWQPLGDLWGNPFCQGDLAQFRPRERAVEPGTPLWQQIVDLTRLRIQEDQPNADDYMTFLDDLRNGLFVVAGRPEDRPDQVILRPRTLFNPLGSITTDAARLVLVDRVAPAVEKVTSG